MLDPAATQVLQLPPPRPALSGALVTCVTSQPGRQGQNHLELAVGLSDGRVQVGATA